MIARNIVLQPWSFLSAINMIFTHVWSFVPMDGQLAFHWPSAESTPNDDWLCALSLVVQSKINATGRIDLYIDLSTAHLRCRKELAKKN